MKSYFFIFLAFTLALAVPLRSEPLKKGEIGSDSINATIDALLVVATAAPVNGVAASRVLTSTGTAPANNDTVTVAGKTYTFQTTLTNVANNVLIGASASIALDNLKSAVNGTAGSGTTYAALTVAHTTITAGTKTSTTLQFDAVTKGTLGNAYASTEVSAQLSFPGAVFTGGVDGTLGQAKELRYYNGYLYFTPTRATTSTATWLKSAQWTAP